MRRLVTAVQDLSMARDLETVQRIVRTAARELTGADGATLVLRDGNQCYYADEDAIEPLWKGSRFPLDACVSGWAMMHKESVVIPDIYADARVPHDAYRPTFVKSMAMVPIRTKSPIGAIGNYWATPRMPTEDELQVLCALADSTSIALENVQLYQELERRVADRTAELEAFSYTISHDLRAPLRAITGFTHSVLDTATLAPEARADLQRVENAALHMNRLIDDLLGLSRTVRQPMERTSIDLSLMAQHLLVELKRAEPERHVAVTIQPDLHVEADEGLLRALLDNLLSNAWKFTSRTSGGHIEVGCQGRELFVRDNGAGFDIAYVSKLFRPFQRLHSQAEFPGTGIGLATVERIVRRHGGAVRAESTRGQGATFFFSLAPPL